MSILTFDHQKTTQAINFFASKSVDGKINKMKVLKLIWAMDRYHVRRYARTVTGDTYFAMKLGPVPSGAKDIAEESTFFSSDNLNYSKSFIKKDGKYIIQSIASPDLDIFSDSEIEAMDFALNKFGGIEEFNLAKEVTHLYPEWKNYEQGFETGQYVREAINLLDFFKDPESYNADYFATDIAILKTSLEEFQYSAHTK